MYNKQRIMQIIQNEYPEATLTKVAPNEFGPTGFNRVYFFKPPKNGVIEPSDIASIIEELQNDGQIPKNSALYGTFLDSPAQILLPLSKEDEKILDAFVEELKVDPSKEVAKVTKSRVGREENTIKGYNPAEDPRRVAASNKAAYDKGYKIGSKIRSFLSRKKTESVFYPEFYSYLTEGEWWDIQPEEVYADMRPLEDLYKEYLTDMDILILHLDTFNTPKERESSEFKKLFKELSDKAPELAKEYAAEIKRQEAVA